jgi:hypothetical protein
MGSGFKNFTAASILTAADVNNYLMEQSVMSFASTGARDTQITAPEEGMTAFLNTGDRTEGLYTYTAGAWREAWRGAWRGPTQYIARPERDGPVGECIQIGRASCRERV